MNRRKLALVLTIAGWTAAFGVYMGAYYALVKRADSMWLPLPYAEYRGGGDIAGALFFPAYCLDKVLRPSAWGPWVPNEEDIKAKQRYAPKTLPKRIVAH
jgi:hypothetical protein